MKNKIMFWGICILAFIFWKIVFSTDLAKNSLKAAVEPSNKISSQSTPSPQPLGANDKPAIVGTESSGKLLFHSEKEVMTWGDSQISEKLNKAEIELAHRYAKIWQARLIYDLNHDPIESLYIGYNVLIHNLLVNGLCRPQVGISGEIGKTETGNIRFGAMDCFPIEFLK